MSDTFSVALREIRKSHSELFEPRALREPGNDQRTAEVTDFPPLTEKETKVRSEKDGPNRSPESMESGDDWREVPVDEDDFDGDTVDARRERDGYSGGQRQAGIELLAIYRPFHLYPEGEWGVHFFERAMRWFMNLLYRKAAAPCRGSTC